MKFVEPKVRVLAGRAEYDGAFGLFAGAKGTLAEEFAVEVDSKDAGVEGEGDVVPCVVYHGFGWRRRRGSGSFFLKVIVYGRDDFEPVNVWPGVFNGGEPNETLAR